MIIKGTSYFVLNTENTSYVIRVTKSKHLEQLYYGKKIRVSDSLDGLYERSEFLPGNNIAYNQSNPQMTLNNMCLEFSTEGKGDNREAMLVVEDSQGIRTSDFFYVKATIDKVKKPLSTLPSSYSDGQVDHLGIILYEKYQKLRLYLDYYVFEKENVISRTARLKNESDENIDIVQFFSAQLDMQNSGYVMSTFNGAWAREMGRKDIQLIAGKHVNSSFSGTSSNTANPFFMVSTPFTNEDCGIAYGFNLIYSGNHAEIAEVNEFGKTRFLWGINPRAFKWQLAHGEEFEAPEAIMTFSDKGFNGMSQNMHSFVKNHIIRGKWADKERPVLLNSWEASYFDIDEIKLLKLGRYAKRLGIELLVMDDGWFGERNDDSHSLGDWIYNKKKLPNGIKGVADKVNNMGLSFGIWVEPEMVNVRSNLFDKHPEWAMSHPDRPHSEGRNQRLLDLGRPEVQKYIIQRMSRVFSSGNIEYVKWDMNRIVSDIYSSYLPRKSEVLHRYVLGLYHILKTLVKKFPDILFEGCASGGNRFDLGMLCYFPQIWASDDTDALVRAEVQTGYSYGYPQCCWGAHVSSVPNHQTLRVTPLETRYAVSCFGCLGYELNIVDMAWQDLAEVKKQIEVYKKYRKLFQFGQLYRGRSFTGATMYGGITGASGAVAGSVITRSDSNITEWTVVSPDKKNAVGMILQRQTVPNMAYQYFRARGLDEDKYYRFYNREIKVNIKEFGDLVNVASPIHIRTGSLRQDLVSKVYKLDGEKEDLKMFGSAIMNAGVKLSPAYAATGFNENVRVFSDYASRLYYMEET